MAIRYVDLVNGNDANDGSTFALRKKTITSAATGLTGGDTMRIMKSPDPTSLGSCTWSNSTTTVVLPSAVTAEISKSQLADWTVVTNITKSAWTTVDGVRIGTNGVMLTAASAFTTGKAAYAPCTTTDLSAYQQISLIFGNNLTITANTTYLDLCSDATGDVPVVSFLLPAVSNGPSFGYPLTFDYGANLPSGINSIAIRYTSDPGLQVLKLNNIIACKAKSDASSLTLNSLIGLNTTNEPEWYSIFSIDGTTVTLNIQHNWVGSAGALTTYKLQPLLFQDWQPLISTAATPTGFTMPSGSSTTGLVNIEFGWDSTNMSSQTGFTAIDFHTLAPQVLNGSFQYINRLIGIRVRMSISSSQSTFQYGENHFIEPNLASMPTVINANYSINKLYVTCYINTPSAASITSFTANTYNLLYNNKTGGGGAANLIYIEGRVVNIKNLKLYGFRSPYITIADGYIENLILHPSNATSVSYNHINNYNNGTCNYKIKNLICYGPRAAYSFNRNSSPAESKVSIENYTFDLEPGALLNSNASLLLRNHVFIQNYNNTGISKGVGDFYTLNAVTTPVHTAGGNAWEFKITNANTVYYPTYSEYYKAYTIKIGDIPVKANKLVTVSLWVRRAFTTTKCAFLVKPEVSGINDFVVAESAGTANTWEQLTITFTPTVNSVVPLYFAAQYDATNASQLFYFDDLSVTIAD